MEGDKMMVMDMFGLRPLFDADYHISLRSEPTDIYNIDVSNINLALFIETLFMDISDLEYRNAYYNE